MSNESTNIIETMSAELEHLRPMEASLEMAEADVKAYKQRIAVLEKEIERLQRYHDVEATKWLAENQKLKSEADKVIKSITEGAISMFRDSNRCRGLDLESPLGRIANVAFKHWYFVESISSKNTQLQEDKERLLQNNHHLLDEVERLKEDVADARQKACGYQEIINEMERQERHHKYRRCLAMAEFCQYRSEIFFTWSKKMGFLLKWQNRWHELAKKFKEAK